MDTRELCPAISKRIVYLYSLKVGDFVSYLDFEKKEINNKYFVTSIHKSNKFMIKCYDIIEGTIVEFYGDKLDKILNPDITDKYLYEFNTSYMHTYTIGDKVEFIDPVNFNINNYKKNKNVFIIKRALTTKHGILVDLVDYNNKLYPMRNIPILFLKKVEEKEIMKDKNNIKIYNLDDKKVLEEICKISDKEKTSIPNKIDNLNHNYSNKNINNDNFNGFSIETLDVSENHKLISIFDRIKQVEISNFYVDINDKFMIKQVSNFITNLIFKV